MTAKTTATLTPYDTGDQLEAKPWIPYGVKVSETTPAENFGKVDFDDDCGDTVTTIQIVRNDDPSATEPYTIRIGGVPSDFAIEWVE